VRWGDGARNAPFCELLRQKTRVRAARTKPTSVYTVDSDTETTYNTRVSAPVLQY
jgi:hypothetical protein